MTHADLVKELSSKLGKTQKETAEILAGITETVHGALKRGEKVVLKDLATFETKVKEAHEARNPATGDKVQVAEKTVPVVKAVGTLKKVVNE